MPAGLTVQNVSGDSGDPASPAVTLWPFHVELAKPCLPWFA